MTASRFKFRAWSKKDHFMGTVTELKTIGVELCGQRLGGYYPLDEVILMQSTGLLDKNGKEIFERDVVRIDVQIDLANGWSITGPIEWNNKEAAWQGNFKRSWLHEHPKENEPNEIWSGSFWKGCEIVGNIYENPEMVKK